MHPVRLLAALPLVALLAACNQSAPPPPKEAAPAAKPAAQAPAATTAPAKAGAAVPAAAAPLFGKWAADLRACKTSAVSISAQSFEGAENRCDITGLTDNGDGTFTASLACTSQGQSANERIQMTPVFAPTGEGVTLKYLDRGGTQATLLRCK